MAKVPMPAVSYVEDWAGWLAYWHYNSSRRFLTLPEDKGIPVPRTGVRRWSSGANKGKSGVIANSHIVSHRHMSEGEKGPSLRREIKRKERIVIAREIMEGMEDYYAESEED